MQSTHRLLFAAVAVAFAAASPIAHAAVIDTANFTETMAISNGSLGQATSMAWAPDGSDRLFVTVKAGQVRIVRGLTSGGGTTVVDFTTVTPVYTASECGVLGVAFDHDYVSNKYVYLFVTVSAGEQQIIRYTDVNNVGTNKTVLISQLNTVGANHDGGGLGVSPTDGKLYLSIGDNGSGVGVNNDFAQLASKVSRFNLDGTIPNDNPFFDGPGPINDAIWARGFRNPFTLTFQPTTGRLWVNVVGTSYEQVFAPVAGDHAGYNAFENNQPTSFITPLIVYRTNGTLARTLAANGAVRVGNVTTFTTTSPHTYRLGNNVTVAGVSDTTFNGTFNIASVPSPTTFTVANSGNPATSTLGGVTSQDQGGCIVGGAFNDSTAMPSAYRGNFFYGDYNSGRVMRAVVGPGTAVSSVEYFATGIGNITDVVVGPDGAVYYLSAGNGNLYRTTWKATQQDLIVSATHVTVNEGRGTVITARLATAPTANVVVNVARTAGDSDIGPGSATLTFTPTNFAVPQPIAITAAEDGDAVNDTATLTLSSGTLASQTVDVNALDNDVVSLVLSTSRVSMTEGATATLTAALSRQPAADTTVTVARSAGDTDVSVSGGASLLFTTSNWATAQMVSIAAATDGDTTPDQATVSLSGANLVTRDVLVLVVDGNNSAPVITSTPVLTGVVGAAYSYDVNANGLPAPTYALGTVPAGMTINATSGAVSWTPTMAGSFNVTVRALNGVQPDAAQMFTITVTGDTPPTCVLTRPTQSETVSGPGAEFFGDCTDDVHCVRAEFSIDGMLRFTDTGTSGHYHVGGAHLLWNTTQLQDGPHTVRMTGFDTANQTCFKEVTVTVNNTGVVADMGLVPFDLAGVDFTGLDLTGVDLADPNQPPPTTTRGCGCHVGARTDPSAAGLALLLSVGLVALWGRRRRR